VQVDIMDGKFAKNVSVSLKELRKIKIKYNLEIHLMVLNPERYFQDCKALGAKRVIWHMEAAKNPFKVLKEMEKYNFQKGIALNPETSVDKIKQFLSQVNTVLLLGVTPGFQGQTFQPAVLEKIKKLRQFSKKIKIGVDGGVNISNIGKIVKTGADILVVGSYLFEAKDIRKNFQLLKKKI
jgi:ribulose-phosphate 3-epimerase